MACGWRRLPVCRQYRTAGSRGRCGGLAGSCWSIGSSECRSRWRSCRLSAIPSGARRLRCWCHGHRGRAGVWGGVPFLAAAGKQAWDATAVPSADEGPDEGGADSPSADPCQKHHVFPQKFREDFEDLGINNIDDYTIPIPRSLHQELTPEWEQRFEEFFNDPDEPPTAEGAAELANELMKEWNLDPAKLQPWHP